MNDALDEKLITAAFSLGAEKGWNHVSVAAAARAAGLNLPDAREAFSGCRPILKRFGQLADSYALTGALTEGTVKDRLFDILLRRFDYLQMHRGGVIALLRSLPLQPGLAPWLAMESLVSMGWMLEGAGVSSTGLRGEIRKRGLAAVWGWGMRAWLQDDTTDLSATMAAVDVALSRADQIAGRFSGDAPAPEANQNMAEPELPLETPD
ncbi:MAG: TetR family transcriptional regulator [Acidocella sp. 20-57-95]|nr:MAG: TetR family transcriptional regulator [Acidocella sp. 20-57-95]OYV59919.1 MAG: TetR family transcriptional regulator [Acidocella sp. 21-58-7]HQT63060.1 TetR family transcriptional regulator [Acidocella sp.]HQU04722.1 TetR family transcriptional regulator [Acidocella sp.]